MDGQNSPNRFTAEQKQRAHYAVHKAVVSGTIPQAGTRRCVHCGKTAEVYHHHKGYAQEHALSVEALCTVCHGKVHGHDERAGKRRSLYHKRPSTQRRVNTTVPLTLYDRVLDLESRGQYVSFTELLTKALQAEVERLEALPTR